MGFAERAIVAVLMTAAIAGVANVAYVLLAEAVRRCFERR